MTLRLGGDGAITGCTSLENPDLTVSGLTISGSFDAEKVLVASGTAAAPSYTFSGDTDNGLYYAGTNSIGVSTAGTSAIVVDSSQRVGIGAASIDRHFHVEGTANVQGKFQNNASLCLIEFEDVNTTAGNRPSFGSVGNEAVIHAAGSERMRIDSSGRLLVGKTNATSGARLQIQGISTNPASYGYMSIHRGSIPSSANDDLGYITFEDSSSNQGAYIQARRDGGTWTSGSSHPTYLAFWTTANGASSPTERMRIDSSGNLLHGMISSDLSATHNLMTAGGFAVQYTGTTGTYLSVIPGSAGGEVVLKADARSGAYPPMTFATGGSEKMRLDSSGRLLVGTTSAPANTLSDVSIIQSGASTTKVGYQTNVGNTFTSISGATVGNETSVYLVTIRLIGDGNFYSTATYILNSAAYDKTFTQLGTASDHFNNGYLLAQLSSYSGTSSSIQVRRSNSGLATCYVHMLKLI